MPNAPAERWHHRRKNGEVFEVEIVATRVPFFGHAAILGQKFSVWHGGRTWTLLLDHRQAAGQTRILAALRWLVSHQDIPASATVAQVGFGWEVVSTDGRPMDFTMSRYWLMS